MTVLKRLLSGCKALIFTVLATATENCCSLCEHEGSSFSLKGKQKSLRQKKETASRRLQPGLDGGWSTCLANGEKKKGNLFHR